MEDVDRIIFDTLSRLDCSFCHANESGSNNVQPSSDDEEDESSSAQSNIERLSTSDVVEAVVRLLWACDPSTRVSVPSYVLSEHATARFRMADTLAGVLKNLGMSEEFGYQSLLYHNVFDIRRLFLALIEKLPNDLMFDQEHISPLEQLELNVAADTPWVPEFCRYLRMKYDGRFWHPNQLQDGGDLFPFGRNLSRRRRGDPAAISQDEDTDDSASITSLTSEGGGRRSAQSKPKVLPKPPHLQRHQSSAVMSPPPTDAKDERLVRIEQKRKELLELRYAQSRINDGIARITELRDRNNARLLKLLADPETGLAKLQDYLSAAAQRRAELQERFFEMERAKRAEIEAFGRATDARPNALISPTDRDEVNRRRRFVEQCRATIAERTRIRAKLEKELRKQGDSQLVTSGGERSQYIRRVLEIVASVNKQNQEIARIAKAIKRLEHEVATLDSTLGRTFTVVDAWLGAQADGDSRMERAYRLLVRMHEHCKMIRAAINERAQLTRYVDELAVEVETYRAAASDAQLERLLGDLLQIRQENQTLANAAAAARTQN